MPILKLILLASARNSFGFAVRRRSNQIQLCRHKYTICRPMKPKSEDINPLLEDPRLHVIPEREEYPELWFHVKGYDLAPVESYTRFLHKFIKGLDPTADRVVMPPRTWNVNTFKPRSEITDHQYELKTSHRIIKVHGMANNITSLLLDMVTRHLPPGVELSLTEPSEELNEFKYVPDADIKALQNELDNLLEEF
ncbi:small ribosomal subunit protein uS10m-like [Watersipora subatra]|uniref:small ribosomal subunit protein uS10m-like n=1 Tax=Watersipora subatra TaxID=2589382 RepID=UPI00355B230C